jgi:hypothetical protein
MAGHYLTHPWTTWRPKWHEPCALPFYNSLFECLPMYPGRYAAFAAASVLLSAASALAGPTYTFTTSTGVQPSNVEPITLTQVDSTKVNAFGMFSLKPNGGDATPFGSYGIAIDSTAGNGSGKACYGDLEFTVSRTGGLSTDDFIINDC